MAPQHDVQPDVRGDRIRFRCPCGEVGDWRDTTEETEEDAADDVEAVGGTFGGRPHIRFRV